MSAKSTKRDPRVEDGYKQLDGALCLWSRAKGETPQRAYFEEVTPSTRFLQVGDLRLVVTLTVPEDNDDSVV